MKKVAIVYYSMTENTDYVAKHISENIEADLIRIVPQKEYPNSGFKKFLWGGKSAIMGETPKLEPYEFGETKYDYIIFGTPVWASSFVPPIRTFIKDNRDKLNGNLYVSDAIHKTHIDLNEKGTKAAAVTYFGLCKSTGIIKEKKSVNIKFYKPFMYMIRDKDTNEMLFFGVVYKPNKWMGSTCS